MAVTPARYVAAEMAAGRLGELGWTQEQLAAESGLTTESVNRFLNGHQWPQVRNRAAIGRALWGDPMRLDDIAKGRVPDEQLSAEVAALRALVERLLVGGDTQDEHRYRSRGRAARIREREAREALLDAELEEFQGE